MQRLHEKHTDCHPVMDSFTHSSLGKIIRKAKWLLALDHFLQTLLPSEFASHCHVMNVNKHILILGVSSAAIATRIGFITSQLIYSLQKNTQFHSITHIQTKVCAKHVRY